MNFFANLFSKKPKVKKVDLSRRFDLIGRVGQGSMSQVWRVREAMAGQTLALKVLDRTKTLKFESRFIGLNKPTEGEIAIQLRHPHIVNTIEHGITKSDQQYLVMKFVEGVSLSYLIDMQNKTMQENRLRFIIQIGKALSYLHQQNFIHRDLCPRNILVDQDFQVKLIDFGLVVPNTPDFQKPGNRTGTVNYMAPELVKRQRTDQRIDIFSYGITCFEMYAKKIPWETTDTLDLITQRMNTPPKDIRTFVPEIDEQVAETIMKALEMYPDDRWQTVAEMLNEFQQAHLRLGGADDEDEDDDEYELV